jgi:hypothetical protein
MCHAVAAAPSVFWMENITTQRVWGLIWWTLVAPAIVFLVSLLLGVGSMLLNKLEWSLTRALGIIVLLKIFQKKIAGKLLMTMHMTML